MAGKQQAPEVGNPFDDIPGIPVDHRPQRSEGPIEKNTRLAEGLKDGSLLQTTTAVGQANSGLSHKEIAENARRMLDATGGTRERRDPKADKYSPGLSNTNWQSPEAVRMYNNVGEDRMVIWPHRPGAYEGSEQHLQKLFFDIPEAEFVTRKSDDEKIMDFDVIAVSIPIKYKHMMTVDEAERYETWEGLCDQETLLHSRGSFGDGIRVPVPDNSIKEAEKENAAHNARQRSRDMGIAHNTPSAIFGPGPEGYKRALANIPASDRAEMEREARMGGLHMELNDDQIANFGPPGRRDGDRTSSQFGGFRGDPEYNKWMTEADKKYQAKWEKGQRGAAR